MKTLNRIGLRALITVCLFVLTESVFAQSTVYFFSPSVTNAVCRITVNGDKSFRLRGDLKKTIKPVPPQINYPMEVYSKCGIKCSLNLEGKVLFALVADRFDSKTGKTINDFWRAELQLNLSEGSVHYVKLAPKGFSDVQLKEITEEEAQKLMKDKKRVMLPDFVIE